MILMMILELQEVIDLQPTQLMIVWLYDQQYDLNMIIISLHSTIYVR